MLVRILSETGEKHMGGTDHGVMTLNQYMPIVIMNLCRQWVFAVLGDKTVASMLLPWQPDDQIRQFSPVSWG